MSVKQLNLVKYAGEYWFTLADFTQTRDTEGYSDHASVKSAIRTYIVRQNPDKYIAFRGELQLRNIIQENKNNPLFNPRDFQGHTRTALIHWSMLEELNTRFKVSKSYKVPFQTFVEEADNYMKENEPKPIAEADGNMVQERSAILRSLRNELQKLERDIKIKQKNREKILQAINAMESLELEES